MGEDLYAADKANRVFLHTRFGLGEDVLEPYKEILDRWLWPDIMRNQNTSVAKAKQAVANYQKAIAEPAGLAELTVPYCETAVGFCHSVGYADEAYLGALLQMFEEALAVTGTLPASERKKIRARLGRVCRTSHDFGYGVGDEMDDLLNDVDRDVSAK